ncbi:MAG: dockerin type I domain-containing protein [Pirellulaceae bacterium]
MFRAKRSRNRKLQGSERGARVCTVEQLENRQLLAAWQNPVLPLDVNASGLVTPFDALLIINDLNSRGTRQLVEPPSTGGPFVYVDVNADDRVTPLDALLVVNALNQNTGPLNLALSVAPAADPNGNGVVFDNHIEFRGQTNNQAQVSLTVAALDLQLAEIEGQRRTSDVMADSNGHFALQQELFWGLNRVTAIATDALGREVSAQRDIVWGDVVADWNAAILNVVRDWTATSDDPYLGRIVPSAPPVVARNLAIIHAAMFDAMNGIAGEYSPYIVTQAAEPDTSSIAAAASAGYEVAVAIYPGARERAVWDATLAESLTTVVDEPAKERGVAYGRMVAMAILEHRAGDGANASVSYTPGNLPGEWNRTAPDFLPPLVPHWGAVQPLAVADITAYRPEAPPELTSAEYAEAVDEVMRMGRVDSTERTADQSEIALFWADGGGTATPPGHWNRIATRVSLAVGEATLDRARTLALLNLALADAGIAAWDAKYAYDLWRPIDAIRRAAEDDNAATVADTTWLPLIRTPPFPAYTSGHSTFSGAAAAVLTGLFGDDLAFASRSDGHTGLTQKPLTKVLTREFSSFQAAAEEAGLSRIYGGIHFQFDNSTGLAVGSAIGSDIVTWWLRPIA